MDIRSLENGIEYKNVVDSVRQSYHVFEGHTFYLVATFSAHRMSGNYNIIDKKAVAYVHSRFAERRKVTANAVTERARRTEHARDALAALNILYVLVAIGAAKIEARGAHQQLFFRVLKRIP